MSNPNIDGIVSKAALRIAQTWHVPYHALPYIEKIIHAAIAKSHEPAAQEFYDPKKHGHSEGGYWCPPPAAQPQRSGDQCETCGFGFILPSMYCDHCNTYHGAASISEPDGDSQESGLPSECHGRISPPTTRDSGEPQEWTPEWLANSGNSNDWLQSICDAHNATLAAQPKLPDSYIEYCDDGPQP